MTHRAVVLVAIMLALVFAQGCPKEQAVDPPTLPQETVSPDSEPLDVVAPTDEVTDEPTDETTDEPTEEDTDEPSAADAGDDSGNDVALVSTVCAQCHDLARVKAHDPADESWAEVIDEMKEKAAGKEDKEITDEDAAAILAFVETEGAAASLPDPEPAPE